MTAALMLAAAAWNSSIGDDTARNQHRQVVAQIEWDVTPWIELKSNDTEKLICALVSYKQKHFSHDLRRISATEMTPQGNFRVHWEEPDNLTAASFVAPPLEKNPSSPRRRVPIATKLVKKMKQYVRGKVVDLDAVVAVRNNAEALQKTAATQERLADHHSAHAVYVYAQNQTSVMAEQLTALKEMDRFTKLIFNAEEKHMKLGPARDYWAEFVFEAYVNHRSDVIFLEGLPNIPESRPHSRINSR